MADQNNQSNREDLSGQKAPETATEPNEGLPLDSDQGLADSGKGKAAIDGSSSNKEQSKADDGQSLKHEHKAEDKQKNEWEQIQGKILRSPNDIVYECLDKSFSNPDDVCDFCYYHFESLSKELKESDGFGKNIRRLIEYCNNHRKVEEL